MSGSQVAAVVGVCDEIEIIGQCILHLEAQGVTKIVVVDMDSRDGTRERLRELHRAGRIALIECDNDPDLDRDYLMSGVDYARRVMGADWILLQDADEFWISTAGSISDAVSTGQTPAFSVDRYNACLCKDLLDVFSDKDRCPEIANADVWVEPLRLSRKFMDANPTVAWISAQPAPKVIARAASVTAVALGGHGVVGLDGCIIPAPTHRDLLIVHVPFLSMSRFRTKINRVKQVIEAGERYFTGETGWHWRRWVEIDDRHALADEYDKQFLSDAARFEAQQAGAISSAERFSTKRTGAKVLDDP